MRQPEQLTLKGTNNFQLAYHNPDAREVQNLS